MAAKKAIVSEEVQEPHELTSANLLKMGIGRGLHKKVDSRGDIPMKMSADVRLPETEVPGPSVPMIYP